MAWGGKAWLLLVMMLVGVTHARAQESYGLEIAGVEVTSENCNDLSVIPGVSGTVKYDPKTYTLTLNNATISCYSTSQNGIFIKESNVKIELIGENYISAEFYDFVFSYGANNYSLPKKLTLTGGGTFEGRSRGGIRIMNKFSNLVIDNSKVNSQSISGYDKDTVTVRNSSTVTLRGDSDGTLYMLNALVLDGCVVAQPSGATFNGIALRKEGEVVTGEVVIEPLKTYPCKIAGVPITNANCGDLSVIPGVSGKVQYDPQTNTLTLDNATISSETVGIDVYYLNNLTIKVTGENSITTDLNYAININRTTTINGGGTLNATSKGVECIFLEDNDNINVDLVIDSCTVNAKGHYACIAGNNSETLTIRNANVVVDGDRGTIVDVSSLTLTKCKITSPEEAAYDETERAVRANGKMVYHLVIEKTADDPSVGIKDVEAGVPAHKQSIYSLDGIYLGTDFDALPKGIYIKDGKKVMK